MGNNKGLRVVIVALAATVIGLGYLVQTCLQTRIMLTWEMSGPDGAQQDGARPDGERTRDSDASTGHT